MLPMLPMLGSTSECRCTVRRGKPPVTNQRVHDYLSKPYRSSILLAEICAPLHFAKIYCQLFVIIVVENHAGRVSTAPRLRRDL